MTASGGVGQIGTGWDHGLALQMELQGWEQRVCSLQGVAGERQEQQGMAPCAKRHLSGGRRPLGTTCSSAAALLALVSSGLLPPPPALPEPPMLASHTNWPDALRPQARDLLRALASGFAL